MTMGEGCFDQELNKLRVCHKRCNECLLTNGKIVEDEKRAELIAICLKKDVPFICHKATKEGLSVICRGFYDEWGNDITACRIAKIMDLAVFLDPETGQPP
jgi:hypothetical protein